MLEDPLCSQNDIHCGWLVMFLAEAFRSQGKVRSENDTKCAQITVLHTAFGYKVIFCNYSNQYRFLSTLFVYLDLVSAGYLHNRINACKNITIEQFQKMVFLHGKIILLTICTSTKEKILKI